MPRYCIEMAYDGSGFSGWQMQPGEITVQACLQEALTNLLRTDIELTGCGRTDTGVHAAYFVAHFDTDVAFDITWLPDRLNRYLKHPIRIFSIQPVASGFHARFSAKKREYRYYIALKKQPFLSQYSWYQACDFDIEAMQHACKALVSYSDFTSFSKLHSGAKTNICKVESAAWHRHNDVLVFSISADRFLRNMVRAIVGTMVEVGKNKISVEGFCAIIESRNRSNSGQSVPGKALFLTDVQYPPDLFSKTRSNCSIFGEI